MLIGLGDFSQAEILLRDSYPLLEARRGTTARATRRARHHLSQLDGDEPLIPE